MTEALNILVGAGFSFYAGLPLGNDLKDKFEQPLFNKLLRASSSEWMWVETQNEAMIHNGRIGSDHMEYAFILEEVVKAYEAVNGGKFNDYEDFYQYVRDNTYVEGWYEGIIAVAKERFYTETDLKDRNSEYYGFAFRNPERSRPQEIINYLISDLLRIKVSEEKLRSNYAAFIKYISQYKTVNIFSLNHDMVLEVLFNLFGLSYCDGFSCENSDLHHDEKPLLIFKNEFGSTNIRLYKSHGSTNMYAFEHGTEVGATMTRDGKYTYFKPDSYHAKHYARRVNLKTGEEIQTVNFDIVPKFITGKNKQALIQQDYMYSEMHNAYQKCLATGDDLLIVGYSFGDSHMNDELKKFTKEKGPNVVNINYGDKFPFNAPSVKEIQKFKDLF